MLTPERVGAYLDGTMPGPELAEFEARLELDPGAAREVYDQMRLDHALRTLLAKPGDNERVKQSVLAVTLGKPLEDLKAGVMDAAYTERQTVSDEDEDEDDRTRKILAMFRPKVMAWGALAAAACVVIGLGLNWAFGEKIRLTSLTTGVQITRSGQSVRLERGDWLRKGDVISTDANAFASVRYSDGTRIELSPGSAVSISHKPGQAKLIEVAAGVVAVEAAHQPDGKPMTLRTPHATATVIGTEFHVDVRTNNTRIDVSEGKVRVGDGASSVDVGASQFADAGSGKPLAVHPGHRDPLVWPFTSQSPWNQSIGSQACYAPVDSQVFKFTGTLNACFVMRPMFRPERDEPMREFRGNVGPQRLPFADSWQLPRATELVSIGIAPDGAQMVWEFRQAQRMPSGIIQARFQATADPRSSGIAPDTFGAADFGGPAFAGAVRAGELTKGIRHALAIALPARLLNRNSPSGQPYVWPATRATAQWRGSYGTTGNLFLGSLLAIPPEKDLATLGVGAGGPGYELARAMQDYGLYITDASELTPKLFTVDEALPPDIDPLVSRLLPHLQVVTNNNAAAVGGGGTPRRPPAPPLAAR